MPIYLDIDRLERVAMIVARRVLTDEEIRQTVQDLLAADVSSFAKIIDTTAAITSLTAGQVAAIARLAREGSGDQARGPTAWVIDARRPGFAEDFASLSADDRPIRLFTSLREARQWARETMADGA